MEQTLCGSCASCSYSQIAERPFCKSPAFVAGHSVHSRIQGRFSCRRSVAALRESRAQRSFNVVVHANGTWSPPTVSDTKAKFYDGFKKPIAGVYNTVIQELLVQQHIIRYNKNYSYDEVFALGFVSVFDQVLDGVPDDSDTIFTAYIDALDEDPSRYRADAEKLASWAKGLSGAADIKPESQGDEVQRLLADISSRASQEKFLYTKFFAIGLFRLLELTGAKEPSALNNLVKAMNVRQEAVNRDLMTYKGVLSKLSAAKELMKEFIEREKKKQAEREAEKKAKAESGSPAPAVAADAEASA